MMNKLQMSLLVGLVVVLAGGSAGYAAVDVVVQPSDIDAHVSGQPGYTTNNYGTATGLYIGHGNSHTGNWVYTLLQFDLSTGPAVAAEVRLEVYCYTADDNSSSAKMLASTYSPRHVDVHQITSSWSESTVTYSTLPTFAGTVLDTISWEPYPTTPVNGLRNQWYSFDITALYNAWKAGTATNYGVLLKTGDGDGVLAFYSSEYTTDTSLRPKLVITPIPEPGSLALLGLGSVVALLRRRRRR